MIKTIIILLPIIAFMAWYSNNADQALYNYSKQQYVQCLNQNIEQQQATKNCELINPNNL